VLAACHPEPQVAPGRVIGLSTSLPLVWLESGDIRGQLADKTSPHWAMGVLSAQGRVVPLDTLADSRGRLPLPRNALLVLAQPMPISPQENVALDAWVRAGGRLLLFADPMLTASSEYALGDPRGPQRVAMLSPILAHWGLELQFDPAQPAGEHSVPLGDIALPVNLAGRFAIHHPGGCRLEAQAIVARCHIGSGQLLAIGDAAVLDGDETGRAATLTALLELLEH